MLVLCVYGCASYNALVADGDELNNSVREYNELVRRNDFEKAKGFAADAVKQEFTARAEAAKNVKVAEYRILNIDYEDFKGAEIVKVQFDYYLPPASAVKTLVDEQVWSFVYVKEEGEALETDDAASRLYFELSKQAPAGSGIVERMTA